MAVFQVKSLIDLQVVGVMAVFQVKSLIDLQVVSWLCFK